MSHTQPSNAIRTRRLRTAVIVLLTLSILCLPITAVADFSAAFSPAVEIGRIYQNEWGSPFIEFTTVIHPACGAAGRGLYLWNQEITPNDTTWRMRSNKLALVLSAYLSGKKVKLDFYYDPGVTGWAACYIHGVWLQD